MFLYLFFGVKKRLSFVSAYDKIPFVFGVSPNGKAADSDSATSGSNPFTPATTGGTVA